MPIEIPGREPLYINNLVFDYNGTLANDGKVPATARQMVIELAQNYNLYVLTADTYGNAAEQCADLPVVLKTFPKGEAGFFKEQIVKELNPIHCACFGNGFNDIKMFKKAALSIGVLGSEGLCPTLIQHAHIIVSTIEDGLRLFLDTKKIIADLRY